MWKLWRRDKMAAIVRTTFSNAFFAIENIVISIKKKSLNFFPEGPIDNEPA